MKRIIRIASVYPQHITGPTKIYIPQTRNYPDGWTLEVSDTEENWTSQWDGDSEVLSILIDPDDQRHTIRVLPGSAH